MMSSGIQNYNSECDGLAVIRTRYELRVVEGAAARLRLGGVRTTELQTRLPTIANFTLHKHLW